FLLVLLDRVAFGTAVALPVNMANIVAGHVLAMLHELDGEPAIWAFVIADAQTLDDRARFQTQGLGAGDDVGLQVCRHPLLALTTDHTDEHGYVQCIIRVNACDPWFAFKPLGSSPPPSAAAR